MTWLLVVIVSGYVSFQPFQTKETCNLAATAVMAVRSAEPHITAICVPHD